MAKVSGVHDSGLPAGTIVPCGNSVALPRTLMCDGSAVSRTAYPALFAAIGTSFGSGDGGTTFNLPDTRGIFLRGAGTNGTMINANGAAYSATLGAKQNDQFQGHWHNVNRSDTVNAGGGQMANGNGSVSADTYVKNAVTDGTNGAPRTGVETRPANLGVNYCIAY